MDDTMKKDRLLRAKDHIDSDIEEDMKELYDRLYKESLAYNAKTMDNFLKYQEPARVQRYISDLLITIKNKYVETIKDIPYRNGVNYTEGQALSMWSRIAGRTDTPVLQEADMEKLSEISIGAADAEKKLTPKDEAIFVKLTPKDKAILIMLALGTASGVASGLVSGIANLAFSGTIPSILRLIPIFLGRGSVVLLGGSGVVAGWQFISDKKLPLKGLFRRKPRASSCNCVDRKLVKEIIDTQKHITIEILKKWNEGIFEKAIQEEPVL